MSLNAYKKNQGSLLVISNSCGAALIIFSIFLGLLDAGLWDENFQIFYIFVMKMFALISIVGYAMIGINWITFKIDTKRDKL